MCEGLVKEFEVRGRRIRLNEAPDILAIKMEDASVEEYASPGLPVANWQGWTLVTAEAPEVPKEIRQSFTGAGWIFVRRESPIEDSELESPIAVGRLYRDEDGEWMIAAGRLSVRLREDIDEDHAHKKLEQDGLEIVRQMKFARHLFEVQVAGDEDVFDLARRLGGSEDYIYAEPQMIRKISKRVR
jgi:hypothetical protein